MCNVWLSSTSKVHDCQICKVSSWELICTSFSSCVHPHDCKYFKTQYYLCMWLHGHSMYWLQSQVHTTWFKHGASNVMKCLTSSTGWILGEFLLHGLLIKHRADISKVCAILENASGRKWAAQLTSHLMSHLPAHLRREHRAFCGLSSISRGSWMERILMNLEKSSKTVCRHPSLMCTKVAGILYQAAQFLFDVTVLCVGQVGTKHRCALLYNLNPLRCLHDCAFEVNSQMPQQTTHAQSVHKSWLMQKLIFSVDIQDMR